jgi:lysophospholipase L1-like esterase
MTPAPGGAADMGLMRKILFACLPTLLLFGVFALGFLGEPENDPWINTSPLWGPGDPFFSLNPAQSNHLSHPVLIWRGRPGYAGKYRYEEAGVVNHFENNAYGFRDDELVDPKPASTVRVLNVGDSATWGLNLASRRATYSDRLEEILARRGSPDVHYDVVNAGVVGYSSLQGARLLDSWLGDLDADVVTTYLGNNDPSPALIKDAQRVAATAGPFHALLQRNRFYLLLQKGLQHLRAGRLEEQREALKQRSARQEAYDSLEGYYRLSARVTPDQYEENLREIVRLAREAKARPILLEVPMNLVWPMRVRPFARDQLGELDWWGASKIEVGYLGRVRAGKPACRRSLMGHSYLCLLEPSDFVSLGTPDAVELARRAADPSLTERERLRSAHNGAVRELAEGDPARAAGTLEVIVASAEACQCLRPRQRAWVLYNLGIARLLLEQTDAAFEALLGARSTWPFAISPDYAERFHRVVEELDVEWIDLPKRFAEADPRFRGSSLIHDWVHPDQRGSAIIARALAAKLLD